MKKSNIQAKNNLIKRNGQHVHSSNPNIGDRLFRITSQTASDIH